MKQIALLKESKIALLMFLTVATVASFALFSALPTTAYANPGNVTVTAVVSNVFELTVTQPTVSFGTLTPTEVVNGKTLNNASGVVIRSNRIFTLSHSMTDFSSTPAGFTMPVSAFSATWTADGMPSGAATLMNTNQTITSTGLRGNRLFSMNYTLTPGLEVEPTSYQATITYTAIQN